MAWSDQSTRFEVNSFTRFEQLMILHAFLNPPNIQHCLFLAVGRALRMIFDAWDAHIISNFHPGSRSDAKKKTPNFSARSS